MPAKSSKPPVEYAAPSLRNEPDGLLGALPWLFLGYALLLPLGTALLSIHHEITQDRARFHVVNALTLTGFQSIVPASDFPPHAQATIFALTVAGILFTLCVGGVCARRVLDLPWTERQVIEFAIAVTAMAVILGAVPLIGAGRSPLNALMLSASSFGNSGLFFEPKQGMATLNGADALPGPMGWQTLLIVLPLAFLGGLGLPVLMDLWNGLIRRKPLHLNSLVVLRLSAGLYILCFFVFLLIRYFSGEPGHRDIGPMLASSSAQAINARTLGLPFEYVRNFPLVMQWMVVLPMIIGGGPASTAGGLKVTTLYELVRGVRRCLTGQNPGPAFAIALIWTGLFFALIGGFFLLLVASTPDMRADQLLFTAISGISSTGLSHSTIQFVTPSLDFLSAAMLAGRLVPLMILWWQARVAPGSDVAIG